SQSAGASMAIENPVMPRKSTKYKAGLNCLMSYMGKSQASSLHCPRLLIPRHRSGEVDSCFKCEPFTSQDGFGGNYKKTGARLIRWSLRDLTRGNQDG